jgi:peptidoglycan/LPS O-acetylase OafA/YrhL
MPETRGSLDASHPLGHNSCSQIAGDPKDNVMSTAVSPDILNSKPVLSAPAAAKPRVVFLDVIRGLAALCVLFQHTMEEVTRFSKADSPFLFWSFRWFNFGRVGVAAFFLVSGFVIPYSLEGANSLKTFWVSRFFRLYPLFWFSILVVLVFHLCGNDEMMMEYLPIWKKTLLVNITMLEEFLHVPHAIELYWTLTLELVFYVIFSALFAVGVNKKTLEFGWLAIGGMLLIAAAGAVLHHKLPVSQVGLLTLAFLGTAAFRYYGGQISQRQLGFLAIGGAIVFAIAFRLGFRSPLMTNEDEWSWVSMFTSYAGGAVLFAAIFLFRGSEFPFPLRWLGMISYSVYLLHRPCWLVLMPIPHHGLLSGPVWQLTVLAVTCTVASLTYLFIEKPAVELGKHLLGKPKPATELGRPTAVATPIGRVTVVTEG